MKSAGATRSDRLASTMLIFCVTQKLPMKTHSFPILAALALLCPLAHAFPIAVPGTEGLKVFVGSTSDIIAKYEGNSAAYSNDLYLDLGGMGPSGEDVFIFNNHGSAVGSTVNLGSFAIGTELIFRLHVTNTGDQFYTGPASRNPDGYAHARVETGWLPGTTLVSFEDLYDGPFDFNDLSFSFTNTVGGSAPPPSIPDPASSGALLVAALAGLIALRRRSP